MKIELHVHSAEISPCGWMPVREVIELYVTAGYDAIVLTNHFSPGARAALVEKGMDPRDFHRLYHETVRTAQSVGKEKGLLVLGAYEVRFSCNANDYLVYGMTEEQCRDVDGIFAMTPEEFSAKAKKEDFLFYQAHPFRNGMTVVDPELLFGMEVRNTHPRHDSRNDIALAWAEKYHLHKIAGSDCHRVQDLATAAVLTDFPVKDISGLVHMLRGDLYTIA
ncbi:MAG: PHP domain-containing protein [Lentisphaeria bacterium]|nr:PHP domain-containing protein [Lentisphaeria bacterium]